MPSGLTRIEELQRSVSLSDQADPLSMTGWTEQRLVNGKLWTSSYDVATRLQTMTSPTGLVTTQTFNAQGDLVSMEAPGVVPWAFAYDNEGKLTSTVQTDGVTTRSTTMTYAPTGYLATVLDGLNQLTAFEHDAVGRVTQETRPDSEVTAMTYDQAGNLTSVTPPGKPAHLQSFTLSDQMASYTPPAIPGTGATSYTYNPDHQLTAVDHPTGEQVGHGYDAAGRLSTVTTAQGTYGRTYDPVTGKLTALTAPGGQNLDFLHDGSLLTKTTWSGPVAGSYERSFDNFFRVASEQVNGGALVVFGYDDDGRMVQAGPLARTFDAATGFLKTLTVGAVEDTWTHNAFGEVQTYTSQANGATVYAVTYQRDVLGRLSGKVETLQGVTRTLAYSYDPAGRLTDVVIDGASSEHYEYDANGNRLLGVVDGVSSVGVYNAQDRQLSYGSLTFTYNARGDLESQTDTASGAVTTYQYDSFGNLRRVELPSGDVVEYVVDGQNRRVGRKVNGVMERGWLYRGQLQPVAELDATGGVRQVFVRVAGEHSPDLVEEGGTTYRVVKDRVGSSRLVINTATGSVVLARDYDSFGRKRSQGGVWAYELGYAGHVEDSYSLLTRAGARDFAPHLGRWLTRDRLYFDGKQENLYALVHGDPVNFVDLDGNFAIALPAAAGAAAGPPGWAIVGGTAAAVFLWWYIASIKEGLSECLVRYSQCLTCCIDKHPSNENYCPPLDEYKLPVNDTEIKSCKNGCTQAYNACRTFVAKGDFSPSIVGYECWLSMRQVDIRYWEKLTTVIEELVQLNSGISLYQRVDLAQHELRLKDQLEMRAMLLTAFASKINLPKKYVDDAWEEAASWITTQPRDNSKDKFFEYRVIASFNGRNEDLWVYAENSAWTGAIFEIEEMKEPKMVVDFSPGTQLRTPVRKSNKIFFLKTIHMTATIFHNLGVCSLDMDSGKFVEIDQLSQTEPCGYRIVSLLDAEIREEDLLGAVVTVPFVDKMRYFAAGIDIKTGEAKLIKQIQYAPSGAEFVNFI